MEIAIAVNTTGTIVQSRIVDSAGKPLAGGAIRLTEAQICADFGQRYFNPALSMWMTADPALGGYLSGGVGGGACNPSNLSLYSYSWANPATFRDPNGRNPLLVTAGIGAGVATAGYVARQWYVGEEITWKGAGAAALSAAFGSGAALVPAFTAGVGAGLTVVGGRR